MALTGKNVIVLPGYMNSGDGHWQTRWEADSGARSEADSEANAEAQAEAGTQTRQAADLQTWTDAQAQPRARKSANLQLAQFRRVPMRDWDHPVRDEWCATLDAIVASTDAPIVFAAHSLGCLTVAFWAAQYATADALSKVAGALLVAVPDPAGPAFPADASGFSPVPSGKLPFASIVVASTDDPYGDVAFSQRCAADWGSRWESIGPRGHINADSGLGDWQQGQAWLASLG